MIFAEHLSDNGRRFSRLGGSGKTDFIHRVENAAMDWFQAVANVGQSARGDDRHRVVQIRLAHLGCDIAGQNALTRLIWGLFFICHDASILPEIPAKTTLYGVTAVELAVLEAASKMRFFVSLSERVNSPMSALPLLNASLTAA